ncbi:MAG TPA: N-acetylmuramoyl-L-alanine amidase [Anaeromyxobacteraceae bacterium]|nr:N-acetylmuramoyl-L-alanine amidase [Anaeromyxobacteraceae bacterium]
MIAPAAALLALAVATEPQVFTVVIDPGHGGSKHGARSPQGDTEKALALAIAERAARRLKKEGIRVVLTRTGDIDVELVNRAAVANAIRADLFLSIHMNSMPTRAQRRVQHGIETFFLSADATDASATAVAARENADRLSGEPEIDPADPVSFILRDLGDAAALTGSSRLAYALHEELVRATRAEDRGVKQAPFYVLAGANMPAVLLEVGFISHPAESARLRTREYQERIADAIAAGVEAFRRQAHAALR